MDNTQLKNINKLKNKINKRIVCIISHGNSVKELEEKILELKNYNICWVSLCNFLIVQEYILDKINKKFEIIFDSAPSSKNNKFALSYEKNKRIPSFIKVIERGDLLISDKNLIVKVFSDLGFDYFYKKYKDKIVFREETIIQRIYGNTNNTITWFLYFLALGEPEKIIIFGEDGYIGEKEKAFDSYYRKELRIERKKAFFKPNFSYLSGTEHFNNHFKEGWKNFQNIMKVTRLPEIINCSPNSIITSIKKIGYSELNIWESFGN